MNNAQRLREALRLTRSRDCDKRIKSDEPLPMLNGWDAMKLIESGQILMISRKRVESILDELENPEGNGRHEVRHEARREDSNPCQGRQVDSD